MNCRIAKLFNCRIKKMNLTQIIFWILSGFAIISAIMVLMSKNPVHSVLWLIAVFFAISGHYILLNAQFLAIVNLIVYAGAIMVLFLFVIMLMNLNKENEPQKNVWKTGWCCKWWLFVDGFGFIGKTSK